MNNDMERRVELIYNEYKFDFQFKRKEKIGKIQEDILSKVSLMIYNIECTKVFFEGYHEYILGDEKMLFLDKWENFEEKEEMKMKKIEKIVVYDRKRDENGNVIKENKVIEQFNRYIQCEETERYIESMNQTMFQPSFIPPAIPLQHSNITFHQGSFARSLMSDLLRPEFLRSFQNTIFTQRVPTQDIGVDERREEEEEILPKKDEEGEEGEEEEVKEDEEEGVKEEEEGVKEEEEGVKEEEEEEEREIRTEEEEVNIDNIIQNELSSLVNVVNEYVERTRNRSQVRVRMSGLLNQNSLLNNFQNNLINEMNNPFLNLSMNIINTNQNEVEETEEVEETKEEEEELESRPIYSANNILFGQPRIVRLPLHDTSILQNHTNIEVLENLMTSLFGAGHFEVGNGEGGFYDDVKVCLDENDFNTELEHFEYKNKENEEEEENKECIICTDAFKEGDLVSKTRCGHLFHDDCLRPWLLNQSVKCPVCRTEVAKGKPKNCG